MPKPVCAPSRRTVNECELGGGWQLRQGRGHGRGRMRVHGCPKIVEQRRPAAAHNLLQKLELAPRPPSVHGHHQQCRGHRRSARGQATGQHGRELGREQNLQGSQDPRIQDGGFFGARRRAALCCAVRGDRTQRFSTHRRVSVCPEASANGTVRGGRGQRQEGVVLPILIAVFVGGVDDHVRARPIEGAHRHRRHQGRHRAQKGILRPRCPSLPSIVSAGRQALRGQAGRYERSRGTDLLDQRRRHGACASRPQSEDVGQDDERMSRQVHAASGLQATPSGSVSARAPAPAPVPARSQMANLNWASTRRSRGSQKGAPCRAAMVGASSKAASTGTVINDDATAAAAPTSASAASRWMR